MKYCLFLSFLISSNLLLAQSKNLEGIWVLQRKEHLIGPEYINALPTQITFSHTKDSLIVDFISEGVDGKQSKGRVATAFDGKETVMHTAGNRKVKRKLQLVNGENVFTITSAFYIPDNENEVDFTRVETLKVIDGRLLINKKSIETRSETWEVNGVYTKK